MGFITDDELRAQIEEALKPRGGLGADWNATIVQCNSDAYDEIVTVLRTRGFTMTGLGGWREGKKYQKNIALFYFFSLHPAMRDAEGKAQLDESRAFLDQLKTVALYDSNGDPIGVSQNEDLVESTRDEADKIFPSAKGTNW